jgi:hypothetical protein
MIHVRRTPLILLLIGLAVGLALAGCAAAPAAPSTPPLRAPLPTIVSPVGPLPTVLSPLSPLPTPMKPSVPPTVLPGARVVQPGGDPVALQATNAAIDDLSKRTGIPRSDIKVVSVEAVEWPDASVGCPQPGMMYAQVITPGYRIVLEAGGKTYEYHSGGTGVVLCQPQKRS